MKKTTFSIFTLLILTLTACSGSASNRQQQFNQGQFTNTSPNELPLASKLVIGSFKLEGTDYAITPEQAAELLPLWQVYQQLSTSDTAAQEEITALTEQIQETMTPEQMQTIDGMSLTSQDIFTVMQEQGITGQGGRTFTQGGSGNGDGGAFPGPPGGGGQFFVGPGNGGGPSGGGFGGGQGLSPEQIATAQARRAENGGGAFQLNGTPAPLIEALVKLLQEKAGS